nr:Ger(x)C family spore germination C-terminal domain-containing protein [Ruminiclostridium cellulolyticum]
MKEEAQKTLEKCQKEYKSDIFGFGMYTFQKYPKYWGKSKNIWDEEIFPKLKINIDVNGNIVRSGMLIKSIRSK